MGMNSAPGVQEIVRFLRRFADLVSTGHNAGHLLCAANLIETLINRVKDTEQLLEEEQGKTNRSLELREAAEIERTHLERKIDEATAELAEQKWMLNEAVINAGKEKQRLLDRAKQAEAQLAVLEDELTETRSLLASSGDGLVLVPVSTLRHAEAQFEALAREAADVIVQAMCEVGASALDRLILESAAKSFERSSKHAA
jgi:DNA repair exonuclease SbcCD ATPase subunit